MQTNYLTLIKKLALLSLVFILTACANKGVDLSSGKLGSLVMFNEESFLAKEANVSIDANFNATGLEVVLNNPANKILVTYNLDTKYDKVYLTETSAKGFEQWNLNRVRVEGEDYFYAKDKNKLYVILNAPSYYLLDSSFGYQLNFVLIAKNQQPLTLSKSFVFHWKPLNEQATSSASNLVKNLVYFPSLAEGSKEIGSNANKYLTYQKVQNRLAEEISHSNSLRLAANFCNQVNVSLANLNLGSLKCVEN